VNDERSERGQQYRVGLFVLVAVVAFLGMVWALGARARLFESRYVVHADFSEVGGLVEGATVRLAGVQIGRVTRVHLPPEPGGRVRVDLSIARRFSDRVRKDSVARIETQGLLGDKIVELSVGTTQAPPTKDDDAIAGRDPADFSKIVAQGADTVKNVTALADSLKQTVDSINKSRLVDDASATLANARTVTEQVGRIVNEVEHGKGWAHTLVYEEPIALRQLNQTIATTQRVLDRVERGEGAAGVLASEQSTAAARRFVAAMDRIARLTEQPGGADEGLVPALLFDPKYRAMLDDVRVVAHNFREVSDRLVGGKGTLGGLIKDEPADASIRQASRDLQAALANLKEITAKVNDGEGTIGALIADPTVYERLVAILDGAQRSFLLRGLLRNLGSGKAREGE
jgi:phospholipid/cholesterol/gamma-HCH transport system substrate-binding protein